jgi:hypothetical protein
MEAKMTFPLADWFDLSKRISREQRELCEDQMALHALKDGLDPHGREWREAVAELRGAVKEHNRKIDICGKPLGGRTPCLRHAGHPGKCSGA